MRHVKQGRAASSAPQNSRRTWRVDGRGAPAVSRVRDDTARELQGFFKG